MSRGTQSSRLDSTSDSCKGSTLVFLAVSACSDHSNALSDTYNRAMSSSIFTLAQLRFINSPIINKFQGLASQTPQSMLGSHMFFNLMEAAELRVYGDWSSVTSVQSGEEMRFAIVQTEGRGEL